MLTELHRFLASLSGMDFLFYGLLSVSLTIWKQHVKSFMDVRLYASMIIWALSGYKCYDETLASTLSNINLSYSRLNSMLTVLILEATAILWAIYRLRYISIVNLHIATLVLPFIAAALNVGDAAGILMYILSEFLTRFGMAAGVIWFATDPHLVEIVAHIEFFRWAVTTHSAYLGHAYHRAYSSLFWHVEQTINWYLIALQLAGWSFGYWKDVFIVATPPRLLLELAVVLPATWSESDLSRAKCFVLMLVEILLQSSAVIWAIWSPCDARARRSYVTQVKNIQRPDIMLAEGFGMEQRAQYCCDQRNQLMRELRNETSAFGLAIAILHKSEELTFEEACRRKARAKNIQFRSLDQLTREEHTKVHSLFYLLLLLCLF